MLRTKVHTHLRLDSTAARMCGGAGKGHCYFTWHHTKHPCFLQNAVGSKLRKCNYCSRNTGIWKNNDLHKDYFILYLIITTELAKDFASLHLRKVFTENLINFDCRFYFSSKTLNELEMNWLEINFFH